MFRWPERTDAQPRWKNGKPAQSTTGVASANWTQVDAAGGTRSRRPRPGMWLPISRTNTGRVSARPIQKRRLMSASSRLGCASADTSRGSSAMPQIGQLPGPAWRTCGCIGQVYVAPGLAGAAAAILGCR